MSYTVTIHDRLAGDYELEGVYDKPIHAHSMGAKRCGASFEAFSYTIRCDDSQTCETVLVGYEIGYAVRDLRCFCDMHPMNRLAGWNFDKRGFRMLVDKGYIVPSADHLDHESGYWDMTERGKKLGKYLRKRFGYLKARA